MAQVILREATSADRSVMQALIEQNGLHAAGILAPGSRYWVAEQQSVGVVGCIGLEYGPYAVLLRSAAVHKDLHGQGIGSQLLKHAIAIAATDQRTTIYLFSTDAGAYWTRQGFHEVPVPELCAALPDAFQVHEYAMLGWLPTEVAWRRDLT